MQGCSHNNVFSVIGCNPVIKNTLKSPGYPNNYPRNIDCIYSVPIPDGMALNISFEQFELQDHDIYSFLCQ